MERKVLRFTKVEEDRYLIDGEIEVEGIRALVHFDGDSIDAQRLCRLAESATEEIGGSCTHSDKSFVLTKHPDLNAVHALEHLIYFAFKRRLNPQYLAGMTKPIKDEKNNPIIGTVGIFLDMVPKNPDDGALMRQVAEEVVNYCNRFLNS